MSRSLTLGVGPRRFQRAHRLQRARGLEGARSVPEVTESDIRSLEGARTTQHPEPHENGQPAELLATKFGLISMSGGS